MDKIAFSSALLPPTNQKVWTLCAVCGIEVPLDEAVVPEATDQLTYLCGLDCYARWRAAAAMSIPSLSPKRD